VTLESLEAPTDRRSRAAVAGHPLHPAVVPIPIGFLTAAALSDIGYLASRQAFFARMSRWLIGGGILGGAVAAVLGALDFASIRAARGPTGVAHAAGNATILGLSAASLALRQSSANRVPGPAIALTAVAALMLAVTGWLGGELTFRKRIGMVPPGFEEPIEEVP
jgi:uncharacterized membrane protein